MANLGLVLHYEAVATTHVGRAGYHHGDLPNALADAATDLARGGGPEAVVLREAARRVGVSAAAAYRHYVGHGELLQAVKHRALAALADAMQEGLDSGEPLPGRADDAVRRFRNLGRAYVGFALDNPGLFHTAFCRPDAGPGDVDVNVTARIEASRPYQFLSGSLDELVAVGLLDPARRAVAPIAFWAAVHGLVSLHIAKGEQDWVKVRNPRRTAKVMLDVVLHGLLREEGKR